MEIVSKLFVLILIIAAFVNYCYADEEISNNKHRCKHADVDCIQNTLNFLFAKKFKGYQPFNMVSVDPLKVQSIVLRQGKESPVNIDLVFKNSTVLGIKNCVTAKIVGFKKEFYGQNQVHIKCDNVSKLADYTINGKVLILPISGSGASNITFRNIDLILNFESTPIARDNKDYFQVKNMRLDIDTTRMYISLTNLFNGDKVLGETMNQFLNDNWKEIFGELKGVISNALGKVFEAIINNVFAKHPYSEYFKSD